MGVAVGDASGEGGGAALMTLSAELADRTRRIWGSQGPRSLRKTREKLGKKKGFLGSFLTFSKLFCDLLGFC